MRRSLVVVLAFGMCAAASAGIRVELPPQVFDAGGWKLDVQFMEEMGSPCLLAHGMGRRVVDAKALVDLPEAGSWRVKVRAKNWADGAPGRFRLRVDGQPMTHELGAGARAWAWEEVGTVELSAGRHRVSLEDLTGFDGRCAGVVFEKGDDLAPLTGALDCRNVTPSEEVVADLVVVGGGIPGTCAAVAAARAGLKVALVQDRPVLGGNASSEVRVWCAGEGSVHPVIAALRGRYMNRNVNLGNDDATRQRVVDDEKNIDCRLANRAFAVEKGTGGTLIAVKALDWKRNVVVRYTGRWFVDATGDGWIGFWAGADYRMGREAQAEFNEPAAPEKADRDTLGASLMWESALANTDVPFSAPWAEPHAQGVSAVNGEWNWEYGLHKDMTTQAEEIRDRLLLAIYGAFSLAKKDPVHARRMLVLCPFILGKRESRRLMGDYVYSERDVTELRTFPDAIAAGSWSVDLHYDNFKEGVDFLTTCRQPHYGRYYIPYRAIYSRNVPNLFMAGRCFSCTHVGLGGPRVINTLAQLGVAAGEAAALCRKYACTPRDIWAKGHTRELQRRVGGDWPGNPDPAHANWRYVDDEDAGVVFTGGWTKKYWPNGEQCGNFTHIPGKKAGPVDYPLPVEEPGKYALYAKVPYHWDTEMDSETVCEIDMGGKTQEFTWNPSIARGTWRRLGAFEMKKGAVLRLIPGRSRGTIIADGYAIVPVEKEMK